VSSKPIAVIPARANSKRIPNKNVKLFGGKPMIVRAIETILEANIFSEVFVSTESASIAQLSKNSGATVPFSRPKELSEDNVRADQVMNHMAQWVTENFGEPDICLVLPTTPGLKSEDFVKSHEVWNVVKKDVDALFAVTEYQTTAFRSFTLDETRKLTPLFPEMLQFQTQDLEKTFTDAGQFYWASAQTWMKTRNITAERAAGFILPQNRAVDINEPGDWILAEKLLLKPL
jgi:N-acylneuraminate cytidylyltransferase